MAPILPPRPLPVSKGGAIVRLTIGAAITFGVAVQTAHGQGMPINGWVLLGAAILTLKDLQSYLSQTWGQAFHGEPGPDGAQTGANAQTGAAPPFVGPPNNPLTAPDVAAIVQGKTPPGGSSQ